MRSDEVVGWGDLAAEVVARGAGHVQDVHAAVAERVFGLVDRGTRGAGAPTRRLHDGISVASYAAVRHGGRAVVRLAGRVAGWAWPHDARPGMASTVAATAQATVVGLIGDQLADAGNPVAYPVRLRHDGRDVPVSPRGLAAAYPAATGRLVVLVPGLFETEHAWRYGADRWWPVERATLGERAGEDGWTPLLVRVPSGQPLATNGTELAQLLRRAVATWPVPVERVVLVGHSMGGLLARHAVHVAARDGHGWLDRCTDVVCLGTPHGGSPVARAAARAAGALSRLPETRGLGDVVELRSPGIRDLEVTAAVPDVDGVAVHAVVGQLSRRTSRLSREVVGDLLVGTSSAKGRAGDGTWVRVASTRTFEGLHHFDLLNHPDVDAHVRTILTGPVEPGSAGRPA